MSGLTAVRYIITERGIIAIESSPSVLTEAGRQAADEVAAAIARNPDSAMSALEMADLAKSTLEAGSDSNPLLGSIKVIGSVALGTAIGLALLPIWGTSAAAIAAGAAVGFVGGKIYDWLWDLARGVGESWWMGDPSSAPIISPEEINGDVSTGWQRIMTPIRRDPLAIDLDGDGIETVGIPVGGSPTLFDHDADGVRSGTGWLRPDDAWLVMDRDGNGTIDSGRELFGVDTMITAPRTTYDAFGVPSTTNVTRAATSGFEALSALDDNHDNVFDSQDAAFGMVKLWQDLNQDGISQANELTTLASRNITAISLTATPTNTNLGNGNTVTGQAVVTRTGGSATHIDSVDLQASNLNLANNPFYREFTDTVALTSVASTLPEMRGSGWVRDMREALSLGTAPAEQFVQRLTSFSGATTRDAQVGMLDSVIDGWARTTGRVLGGSLFAMKQEVVSSDGVNQTIRLTPLDPSEWPDPSSMLIPCTSVQLPSEYYHTEVFAGVAVQVLGTAGLEILRKLGNLEAFNAARFISFNMTVPVTPPGGGFGSGGGGGGGGGGGVAQVTGYQTRWIVNLAPEQIEFINQAYDSLSTSVYQGLLTQTRLRPYLDAIDLVIDDAGARFDCTPLVAMLEAKKTVDLRNSLLDLVDLNRAVLPILQGVGLDAIGMLRDWVTLLPASSPLRTELASLGVFTAAAALGTGRNDIYLGDSSSNSFAGGIGDDIIDGGVGNDTLYGDAGNDVMIGAAGNDTLDGGAGNDTLDGGAGNDTVTGGAGNNIYQFGKGDGQDLIQYSYDTTVGKLSTVQLKAGVLPSELMLKQVYDSSLGGANGALELSIAGTTDKATINGFFYTDDPANPYNGVQQIRFSDGTIWSIATIKSKLYAGTAGNDNLRGSTAADSLTGGSGDDSLNGAAGDDQVDGGVGNDTLYGDAGNDVMIGAAGNDTLDGGAGNDTFDGGSGNDTLTGGAGNNTYQFGKGDGQDLIQYSYDTTVGKLSTLQMKAGVLPSEVLLRQVADNAFGGANGALEISIAGTTDKVVVNSFFYGDDTSNGYNGVQQIRFSDGTIWSIATIKSKLYAGTAGNDNLRGSTAADSLTGGSGDDSLNGAAGDDQVDGGVGNDTLYGDAGNDVMIGAAGNDTLDGGVGNDTFDGGTGNDTMTGGAGNNTYQFGKGDGQDLIQYSYDTTVGKLSTLQMKAGVLPSEVLLRQVADNAFGGANGALEISIAGTTDKVVVNSFFYGDDTSNGYNGVQQIRFSDGTIWSIATIKSKLYAGTAGNDNLRGSTAADSLTGGSGNDSLNGAAGNDTVNGGDGNDTLYAEAGDDLLDGGLGDDALYAGDGVDNLKGAAGNDTLDGGAGNDTFDGGTGNDRLTGGTGNNTYQFGKGDGQDLIQYSYDSATGKLSTVQFRSGVAPSEVLIRQVVDTALGGYALELSITGTTDKITINGFFSSDDPGNPYNGVQQVKFADGTTWNLTTIKAKLYAGTTSNDTLRGTIVADTITGGTGDDNLNGVAGDDTLDGGVGNDTLYGDVGNDAVTGAAGNDTLDGGAGNDTLDGGAGNDTVTGGAGNNIYQFGKGDGQDLIQYSYDTTVGKLSTVQLKAGVLPSELTLKQVYDSSLGGANGALELSIAGTTDKVTINGFFYTDDPANPYNGVQQIRFADGTTWSAATIKSKLYAGTAGNDSIRGSVAADTLTGVAGDDVLNGAAGNDALDGGAGNDTLFGDAGNDVVTGAAGNDTLDGGAGNDTLDGGAGTDTMAGGVGNNTYLFGKGDGLDLIQYGYDTTVGKLNTVQFKAGVVPGEVLLRQVADNALGGATGALELSISGTTDKVTINGFFYGNDPGTAYNGVQLIKFADGTVWDLPTVLSKIGLGTAGNDNIAGTTANDLLNGGAGSDTLRGNDGNDVMYGGDGDDALYGEAGNDTLDGGLGLDALDGGAGNDTFDGGAGNDTLTGGTGDNVYQFGKGGGQDLIQISSDAAAGKLSTVQMKAGVTPSEVVLKQVYDNLFGGGNGALEISIAGTTDKVTVNGFFYGDDPSNAYNGVQQIRFSDGTIWSIATIKSKLYAGTAGNDNLRGSTAADSLTGGAGDDSLNGAAGNDTVNGGDGNDTLHAEAGDDLLDGGLGDDALYAGDGVDNLKGAAGNDTLDGGTGNDTFDGGTGNDRLTGGTGNNTYLFGKGDGQDVIQFGYDTTVGRLSTLLLKSGVATSEVTLKQVADTTLGGMTGALELSIAGTTDKITVNGFFYGDDSGGAYNGVQQIRFSDGTIWSIATIKSKLYAGTAGNDNLRGSTAADSLTGGAGNDSLNGAGGNDTVNGGDGNDTLYAEAGDDLLDGGLGDDALYAGDGVDNLKGAAGNDTLDGGAGNDTFDGGSGNDTLTGGAGNNTYQFGKGDGQDLIQYSYDTTVGKLSTLQMKAGVLPSEVLLRQVADNAFGGANGALEISIAGTTDKVVVNSFFYGDDTSNGYNGVQQIRFSDGTIWSIATIKSKLYAGTAGNDNLRGSTAADSLTGGAGDDSLNGAAGDDQVDGGAGNDTLYGDVGNDVMIGAAGNDTLDGGVGNDTFDGGSGNDTMTGGAGNNTYQFGKGDGQDLIQYSYDTTVGKLSTLQMKAGVLPSEVLLRQVADNAFGGANGALEISIAGTTDKVVVNSFFYGDDTSNGYNGVQQIRFSDGTIWSIATIKSKLYAGTAGNDNLRGSTAADSLTGGAGDDSLNGAAGDDQVDGGVGNDTLYGDVGNDVMIGAAGNDTLDGGAGNDTFDGGSGNDTMTGGAGNNTYQFGKGDGQDLIQYSYDTTVGKLSTLQMKAGVLPSEVLLRQVADNAFGGANGALEISIAGTTDKVVVNSFFYGDDTSNGYNGVQQIRFSDGTIWSIATIKSKLYAGTAGNDNLRGSTAADSLTGGSGDDSLNGAAGDDQVDGGVGNDTLYGDAGNDVMIGAAGNDTLDGGVGNDTFDGGSGNDTMTGGAGNNTYQFGKGDGQDLIQYSYDTTVGKLSTVQLKAGVLPSELMLKQVYDSSLGGANGALELSIAGTTDKVTINGFFYTDDPANPYNGVQQIRFSDGTTLSLAAITASLFAGTAGNDNLRGTTAAQTIIGGGGDDSISGVAGDDLLDGGIGNDTLNGDAGNDTLVGGAGTDTLAGGLGNDTYSFGRSAGLDSIAEYDGTAGNTDVVVFGGGVATDQIWFRKLGNDLEVSIIGTADKMLIPGWYFGTQYHLEQFKTTDGKTLLDSKVQDLVAAMAGFAPPAMGQLTLPDNYKTAIVPVITANWGP